MFYIVPTEKGESESGIFLRVVVSGRSGIISPPCISTTLHLFVNQFQCFSFIPVVRKDKELNFESVITVIGHE